MELRIHDENDKFTIYAKRFEFLKNDHGCSLRFVDRCNRELLFLHSIKELDRYKIYAIIPYVSYNEELNDEELYVSINNDLKEVFDMYE